jgi:5-methylcytosine-specific restriction endonuclease McrA
MSEALLWLAAPIAAYLLIDFIVNEISRRFFWKWWYRNYYLKSLHWRFTRWRKKLQMRITKGSVYCERCGSKKYLHIHHVTYQRLGYERMSDLQVICRACHRPGSGRIA